MAPRAWGARRGRTAKEACYREGLHRRDLTILNTAFTLAGTLTTYCGTLLPSLAARWTMSDAESGQLFTAQFIGAMAGALSQGAIAKRWGANRCVSMSYLLMACGNTGLALGGSRWAGLGAVFFSGLGIGWSGPASNLLAARYADESNRNRAISMLNTAWCLGAVVGPVLIARMAPYFGLASVLGAVTLLLIAAAALTWGLSPAPSFESTGSGGGNRTSSTSVRQAVTITSAMLFLYVGVECCISGWTPTLGVRALGMTPEDASLMLSAFWASVLAARFLSSFGAAARLLGVRSLMASLGTIAAGVILMTVPQTRWGISGGAVLAGVGCATVFPTLLALFQGRAGAKVDAWIGFVVAMGSCGASILPWLVGSVSDRVGGLRWSLLGIVVTAIVSMVVLGQGYNPVPTSRWPLDSSCARE